MKNDLSNVPTAEQINVFGMPEEVEAYKHFHGKDIKEAEGLFLQNSVHYQEDLMWMGEEAFSYYAAAAINYIRSEPASDDFGFIFGFLGTLEYRLEYYQNGLLPIAESLLQVCGFILQKLEANQPYLRFYGDMTPRYKALDAQLRNLTGTPMAAPPDQDNDADLSE